MKIICVSKKVKYENKILRKPYKSEVIAIFKNNHDNIRHIGARRV